MNDGNLITQNEYNHLDFKAKEKYLQQRLGSSNDKRIICQITRRTKGGFLLQPLAVECMGNDDGQNGKSRISEFALFAQNSTPEVLANGENVENLKVEDYVSYAWQINKSPKTSDIYPLRASLDKLKRMQFPKRTYVDLMHMYACLQSKDFEPAILSENLGTHQKSGLLLLDGIDKILNAKTHEIQNINKEIDSKNREIEDKNVAIQKVSEEYEKAYNAQQEKIDKELSAYQSAQENKITDAINRKRKTLDELEKQLTYWSNFSYEENVETYENIRPSDIRKMANFSNMIDSIKSIMDDEYGVDYTKAVLAQFYLGLQSNQMLLLVGNPGVGKTSLVRLMAKIFSPRDAYVVPVQSNWSDKSDLLGYYNPLDRTYVTTPFLEALLDACGEAAKPEHQDDIYFICLDEMNLAHVEYYFAEFLSAMQTDRKLRLYNPEIAMNVKREIEAFVAATGLNPEQGNIEAEDLKKLSTADREYYFRLCRQNDMCLRVSSCLTVPDNVKFIGTLNQDATTIDLSPKVIDRSWVIRLYQQNHFGDRVSNFSHDSRIGLQYNEYGFELTEELKDELSELLSLFNNNSVSVGNRMIQAIYRCCADGGKNEPFKNDISAQQFKGIILATILLPRLRLTSEHKNFEEIKNKLREIAEYPICDACLKAMLADEDMIDYWTVD